MYYEKTFEFTVIQTEKNREESKKASCFKVFLYIKAEKTGKTAWHEVARHIADCLMPIWGLWGNAPVPYY
jgi:hypothetical protein